MITNHDPETFRRVLHSVNTESVQSDVLVRRIVQPNEECEHGRRHAFNRVRSAADFRNAVPVCTYEDLRPDIERMLQGEQGVLVSEPVRRYFLTSGSTAAPKYVPVTSSFIRDKWSVFQRYWGMVRHDHPGRPGDCVIANFSDGSREQTTVSGAPCSSESSFWSTFGHRDGGPRNPLPRSVLNIPDADARFYTIARILVETNISALMALNPSTILRLFDVVVRYGDRLVEDIGRGDLSAMAAGSAARDYIVATYAPNETCAQKLRETLRTSRNGAISVAQLWPSLKVVICWRSPTVLPYLELLEPFLAGVPQRDYITMASEGVVAIPFEDGVSGGALAIDTHFYEFIPEESGGVQAATLLAHELEKNRNYVVVVSTSAGLYRYNLGDLVRVKEFIGSTPVVEFLYRTGRTCSLTGEKLTEAQVAEAVRDAAARIGVRFEAFTMCPIAKPFPYYAVIAELGITSHRSRLNRFLPELDRSLSRVNIEYCSKRNSRRLGSPELWLVPPRSYEHFRNRRITAGVSDAQVKECCLTSDLAWHQQFTILEKLACESAA